MKLNEVFSPLYETDNDAGYMGSDHPLEKVLDQYADIIKPIIHNGTYLYRGMRHMPGGFGFGDGSKLNRKSANTRNYYTLIMDNVPEWDPYPKRSKSFICSSQRSGAGGYGQTVYVVIPLEGQDIGVCPAPDLWGSFDKETVLMDINGGLYALWRALGKYTPLSETGNLSETDFSLFKNQLDAVSKVITAREIDEDEIEDAIRDLTYDGFKDFSDILGEYRKLIDPVSHDFKITKDMKGFQDRRECWLSGKVLFVDADDLHNHFR